MDPVSILLLAVMDPVSLVFANSEKATVILLLALAVIGFMRGWIVPGPTHDRVVKERDKYLEAATRGTELALRASTRGMELAHREPIVFADKKDV